MSKLFYDHLILIDELYEEIDLSIQNTQEKQRAKRLIDEIIHHQVFIYIFDNLPEKHHQEFLDIFHEAPFNLTLVKYLEARIDKDVKKDIASIGNKIKAKLRKDIRKHRN